MQATRPQVYLHVYRDKKGNLKTQSDIERVIDEPLTMLVFIICRLAIIIHILVCSDISLSERGYDDFASDGHLEVYHT